MREVLNKAGWWRWLLALTSSIVLNEDVSELFEWVHVGTMVIIQDFHDAWDEIALQHGYKLYT